MLSTQIYVELPLSNRRAKSLQSYLKFNLFISPSYGPFYPHKYGVTQNAETPGNRKRSPFAQWLFQLSVFFYSGILLSLHRLTPTNTGGLQVGKSAPHAQITIRQNFKMSNSKMSTKNLQRGREICGFLRIKMYVSVKICETQLFYVFYLLTDILIIIYYIMQVKSRGKSC